MASGNSGTETTERHLQRPLRDHLGSDETVAQVLTNTRVGVTRVADAETTVEPGSDAGAVAAITDRRVVFVVGDPTTRDDDFVAAVPFDDLEGIEKRSELLTQALVVETTEGVRWDFTARTAAAVDQAVETLERRLAESRLDEAAEHHDVANATDDPAARAEQLEAALDAYRRAAELLGDERSHVSEAERAAREDAETVITTLVAAHRDHGEQATAAAEWELAADNDGSAYELFVEARDAYDRALELARAYPPGDPGAIERERAQIVETFEPLKIEFAVAEAAND